MLAAEMVRMVMDAGLRAELSGIRELRTSNSHVRAASALRRWQGSLVVVQDDVLALAILDADTGASLLHLDDVGNPLYFDDTLGNKHLKPDLEAAAVLPDGRLLLWGSGATPDRERIFALAGRDGLPVAHHAPDLYQALRAEPSFRGSGLNLEGAVVQGSRLLLMQRGNAGGAMANADAIGELLLDEFLLWLDRDGPVPRFRRIWQFDLGQVEHTDYGFTDLCALPDGRLAVLACAENSEGILKDGPVLGCRFGLWEPGRLRMTDVLGTDGASPGLKLEGIELRAAVDPAGSMRFDVVSDSDDPARASCLAMLCVSGA